jgi:hypothetical protein
VCENRRAKDRFGEALLFYNAPVAYEMSGLKAALVDAWLLSDCDDLVLR